MTKNTKSEVAEFGQNYQQVKNAFTLLQHIVEDRSEDVPEIIDDDTLISPEILGQILMTKLPPVGQPMTSKEIAYWAGVNDWMGPDYLRAFAKVGALMNKLSNF